MPVYHAWTTRSTCRLIGAPAMSKAKDSTAGLSAAPRGHRLVGRFCSSISGRIPSLRGGVRPPLSRSRVPLARPPWRGSIRLKANWSSSSRTTLMSHASDHPACASSPYRPATTTWSRPFLGELVLPRRRRMTKSGRRSRCRRLSSERKRCASTIFISPTPAELPSRY